MDDSSEEEEATLEVVVTLVPVLETREEPLGVTVPELSVIESEEADDPVTEEPVTDYDSRDEESTAEDDVAL